ncbi:low-density lipoprotein receptor-related protein 8 [Tachyglossus aculeatus]|uniref:low-density lipoprotein receptor-related protein 8 n=1 Tax=Tachyglossus aculeatus TaxID=9261 RepID=UPI0018F60012|nr:low-density lipoprotein receptor-related protein 8 [Tachyglossus aculeatus]
MGRPPPPPMLLLPLRLLLLLLLLLLLGHTHRGGPGAKPCDDSQFQCRNERCIPAVWKCDEDDDCSDNSDEEDCPKKICTETDFTCRNGHCIPSRWKCDGEEECPDGSDESDPACAKQVCPAEKLSCGGNRNKCIPASWRCDGEKDCENGLDEAGCSAGCSPGEFQCSNRSCIARVFVCDGDDDCGDGSDERSCPGRTCGPREFRCGDGACVPERWLCDRQVDCEDRSDEAAQRCGGPAGLPAPATCAAHEVPCGGGQCIHLSWLCDGDHDCKDKSDEANCPLRTCRPDEFLCGDGSCVPRAKRCNQERDCPDASDEAACLKESACARPTDFQCRSGECIDGSRVCDTHGDCRDWSDEPMKECGLNECSLNNGGCSHICKDLRIGYACECPPGYQLLDKKTCGDIDECESPDACSQICVNYKGDYKCECHEGYEMDAVTRTCKAVGKSPSLIFTNRHEVRKIDLAKRDHSRLIPVLKNVVALDVQVATNRIYWCDLFYRKMYSAYLDKASDPGEHVVLIDSQLHSPEGLAVDWIHRNLYWTDSGNKTISVATADGSRRKTLFSSSLSEPRAIAVDPIRGYMYWSDWGDEAKIEKSGLNGADRQVLVLDNIAWPNGITLDLLSQRLYWVDSKLHLLSSIDFNGGNRKVLIFSVDYLSHPFGIAVFEDKVFWTDLENEAIFSANRLNGLGVTVLAENLNNPHDIVIFHELKQPKAPDACDLSSQTNGGCEYLCLPAPQVSSGSPKYTCACPDGLWLGPDRKRCYRVAPAAPAASSPAAVPTPGRGASATTPALDASLLPGVTTPRNPPREARGPASPSAPAVPTPGNYSVSRHDGNGAGKLDSAVAAAVTGAVVPIVGIALLCLGGYLIWRNWKRKNTKSMNFDNPVYRKTTEDEDEDEIHIGQAAQIGHVYPARVALSLEDDGLP